MPRKNYYQRISKDYTEFVEITPEIYRKLTKKQKKYIRTQAKHYREDIRNIHKENFNTIPDDIRTKIEQRALDIVKGKIYSENMTTTIDNYRKGIKFNGNEELDNKFKALTNVMNEGELDNLFDDIPNLYLYYKDTTGHAKRNQELSQTTIDDSLEQLGEIIDRELKERKMLDDKDNLLKEYIVEDEEDNN